MHQAENVCSCPPPPGPASLPLLLPQPTTPRARPSTTSNLPICATPSSRKLTGELPYSSWVALSSRFFVDDTWTHRATRGGAKGESASGKTPPDENARAAPYC